MIARYTSRLRMLVKIKTLMTKRKVIIDTQQVTFRGSLTALPAIDEKR